MLDRSEPRSVPQGTDFTARAKQVAKVAASHADAVDRDGRFPREAVAAMREARLLGMMIPTHLGGEGADFADVARVCTTLGAACSASGMVFAMHQIKTSSLVHHGLDSDWHRDFMVRLAAEQLLLGSATTEGGIGGDLRNSICSIVPEGDMVRLEKDATVISYGLDADAILATARRAPDAASSDQVMVVIEKAQASLEQTSVWNTLGMRGTTSHGFKLAATVPAAQVFPKPFAEIAAQSMLASSHLFWASLWFGIAGSALSKAQASVRAAARRMPNAVPPGAARLAAAAAELAALKTIVRDGIARFEVARHDEAAINSMAFAVAMNAVKIEASRRAVAIVQEALTIVGIQGYKNDNPFSIGRQLRDILSAPLMIANDRILANTATMLLMSRLDTDLED
ncbi:MAG: acyl-CoA dehydrogenase family protein [Phreatobacter sp.]|uniref:acyl-CoA dehydrogenase family protein n=1 Tax=Phreatobacter sp. TaxID=1966341 RepID=UPI00273448DD|nr:acyl-CoA dehydrogenase family protein [Phreatobacter sp.]MDP2802287.1 acyl-CoA dehydrogenase family protein [Phreatobacter sp.]